MTDLKFKYSDRISIFIVIIVTAIKFVLFTLLYKFGSSFVDFDRTQYLLVIALIVVFFTILITRPLLRKLIFISE